MTRRRRGGKRNERVNPLRALADLNLAITATEEHRAARGLVLRQFARIADDRPVLCEPPMSEQRLGHIPGSFKVIYDSWDDAQDAAGDLAHLGSPPMRPYPCDLGEHFHLYTLEKYQHEKKRNGE